MRLVWRTGQTVMTFGRVYPKEHKKFTSFQRFTDNLHQQQSHQALLKQPQMVFDLDTPDLDDDHKKVWTAYLFVMQELDDEWYGIEPEEHWERALRYAIASFFFRMDKKPYSHQREGCEQETWDLVDNTYTDHRLLDAWNHAVGLVKSKSHKQSIIPDFLNQIGVKTPKKQLSWNYDSWMKYKKRNQTKKVVMSWFASIAVETDEQVSCGLGVFQQSSNDNEDTNSKPPYGRFVSGSNDPSTKLITEDYVLWLHRKFSGMTEQEIKEDLQRYKDDKFLQSRGFYNHKVSR